MEAYEGDGVIPSWKGARGTVQRGGIPTLMTSPDTIGVVVLGNYGNGHHAKNIYEGVKLAPTITTGNHGLGTVIKENDEKEDNQS